MFKSRPVMLAYIYNDPETATDGDETAVPKPVGLIYFCVNHGVWENIFVC